MKLRGVFVAASLAVFLALSGLGLCVEQDKIIRTKVGAVHDSKGTPNSIEIDNVGRFAIQEHNKKQNAILEFVRVLNAKEQVVAGKVYYLTLEAIDAGKKKIYEAKVWVKPWMDFKQLQEFKLAHAVSPFRSSDFGIKQEGHKFGWREVPIHAPEVKEAANHAMKSVAQRSNSLFSYELLEIVLAKGKVIQDYIKFNLLLRVRRGINEEKLRVQVTKKLGGKFYVSWMEHLN